MAIRAKKPTAYIEKAAIRTNRVFKLLQKGKNMHEIRELLGIPESTFKTDIKNLRGGVKAAYDFIPPKGISWSPAKEKKIIKFIEFAKKAIQGEAAVKHKKKGPWPKQIPVETRRKIDALLIRNPTQSNEGIGKAVGTTHYPVKVQRQILVAKGEIPDISVSERLKLAQRRPWSKTHVLSKQQRERMLKKNKETIRKRAQNIYYANKKAFDFCNMLPETAVEKLCEMLDWRLQTFDPARTTLERFFSYSLGKSLLDLKRMAWRKYRRVGSLEAAADGKAPLRSYLKAPPEFEGITVARLQEISSRLRLNMVEKAVLFGRAIGLTDKKIGNEIGYSEASVCLIKRRIEPWVKNLISE